MEELDVLAVWDNESRTLALERGTYKAQFVIHESHAVMNDEVVSLSAPPIVLYNEIYLPAHEVGEALGFKVTWDAVNHALQGMGHGMFGGEDGPHVNHRPLLARPCQHGELADLVEVRHAFKGFA